jgi:hypothetical protein
LVPNGVIGPVLSDFAPAELYLREDQNSAVVRWLFGSLIQNAELAEPREVLSVVRRAICVIKILVISHRDDLRGVGRGRGEGEVLRGIKDYEPALRVDRGAWANEDGAVIHSLYRKSHHDAPGMQGPDVTPLQVKLILLFGEEVFLSEQLSGEVIRSLIAP